jgi:hypothetical protein
LSYSNRVRIARLAIAVVLVAAAYGTYRYRRAWIQTFFVPGSGGAAGPTLAQPDSPDLAQWGLEPVDRVRVVLLDGVSLADARELSNYSEVCHGGLDMVVDTGFPTVSLPVQNVLWTGLTQQQTGILFFLKLLEPPSHSIPSQVAGSRAVAESHQKIVHSLGFERTLPADPVAIPDGWSHASSWRAWLGGGSDGFREAALEAVTSDARLAFVHVLRTDSIAHKRGTGSTEYRRSLQWADALLGDLVAAEQAENGWGTRWFVLADHGHRLGGGHGGAEPWIRQVRGCISGRIDPGGVGSDGYIHLVDFSRAIADSVGVVLHADSAGRPLYSALAAPVDETATLPKPSTGRWALVALLLILGVLATGWAARGRWWHLPWWWPVAYLSVLVTELTPSLSTSMIYKPRGKVMYEAALSGLCLLAVLVALAIRKAGAVRAAVSQLALPTALTLSSYALCYGEVPLMPRWTAHTSLFMVLSATSALVVALAVALSIAARDISRPPGTFGHELARRRDLVHVDSVVDEVAAGQGRSVGRHVEAGRLVSGDDRVEERTGLGVEHEDRTPLGARL